MDIVRHDKDLIGAQVTEVSDAWWDQTGVASDGLGGLV